MSSSLQREQLRHSILWFLLIPMLDEIAEQEYAKTRTTHLTRFLHGQMPIYRKLAVDNIQSGHSPLALSEPFSASVDAQTLNKEARKISQKLADLLEEIIKRPRF